MLSIYKYYNSAGRNKKNENNWFLIGSPRKGSNTEILVEEALKGAADNGASTKIFKLHDMEIAPCKACMSCKSNGGKCATEDDMQILYNELKEADAFILGSPVYMWQMTAQSKLFIDRLYAFFGTPLQEEYSGKNMALIFSQGNPDENTFKEYYHYISNLFEFMGYNVVDWMSSQGNNVPGAVIEKKDTLKEARGIGKRLVEE